MSRNPLGGLVAASLVFAATVLSACASPGSGAKFAGTAIEPAIQAPDFTLEDQYGHTWTLSQQHGRTVALMFGYTHCTDTCPLMMAKLGDAARRTKGPVTVAFVTVDPQRDTSPALRKYLQPFETRCVPIISGCRRSPAVAETTITTMRTAMRST